MIKLVEPREGREGDIADGIGRIILKLTSILNIANSAGLLFGQVLDAIQECFGI
jgi:hypothetical protein